MKIDVVKYRLNFNFRAETSRGALTFKDTYFIILRDDQHPEICGIGECGPLQGLSPDLEGDLKSVFLHCEASCLGQERIGMEQLKKWMPGNYPAVLFALETAMMDLQNGGKRIICNNEFYNGDLQIPINGLVWMGKKEIMLQRIDEKLQEGYDCIKIKIGSINFEEELGLLKHIRSRFSKEEITIRLDANGAFAPKDVISYLDKLEKYDIHSIEQPILAGDWKAMHEVCKYTPFPVALDEELIGLHHADYKMQLLDEINPQYIIIKPSLVGGLRESEEWIQLASQRAVGWWITSALESNIGLNAVAQFTANQQLQMPQGLGTGQIFANNIPSPLRIENGHLLYDTEKSWDLSLIEL
jgi:O-succinylbenzoate synthase